MAYQSKARRPVKELREPIPGNGVKLTPGKIHNVTIVIVTRKSDDQTVIVFQDAFDNAHVETIFHLSQSGKDLSSKVKQLLTATANNTSELKTWYDEILNGSPTTLAQLVDSRCLIETEYNKEYINIKTIRSINDNDNRGDFFQSPKANPTRTKGTTDTERFNQFVSLPEPADSFF